MAPLGTVTVKLVLVALVTIALTAPKYTILLAAVVLKSIPVIVTELPGIPVSGLKDVMVVTPLALNIIKNKKKKLKLFFI